jgi:preprotein translocase subunit YajC
MTPSLVIVLFAMPAEGSSPLTGLIVQFALIFAIFYFLWFRPQQRQRRQQEESLRNIKKGDEVVTAGGIVGEVIHVREAMKEGQPVKTMDDRVTIKSGESRLVVERGRIARVLTPKTSEPSPSA